MFNYLFNLIYFIILYMFKFDFNFFKTLITRNPLKYYNYFKKKYYT